MIRHVCISSANCQYRSDTGYCGYTGNGCVMDGKHSMTIKIPETPTYTTTTLVDISTESINKIAEAVVEKLRNCGEKMSEGSEE